MPSDHRLGLDDDETGFPSGPESEKGNPEDTIERSERRSSVLVGVDRELLTEGKFDDCLISPTTDQSRDRGDDDRRIAEEGSNQVAILEDCSPAVQTDS